MTQQHGKSRFGSMSIAIHWFMLLQLTAVYACAELRGFFPRGSETAEALKTWHYMLGLSVFVMVLLRLATRLLVRGPDIVPDAPLWQRRLATAVQVALYVLMFCLPLAGWLILSARGTPVPFFGLQLPALIAKNKEIAGVIKEIHEAGGSIGYFLIGAHAAAALFHHYYLRDNTLRRMLPGRG